jgi:hypothetical protein
MPRSANARDRNSLFVSLTPLNAISHSRQSLSTTRQSTVSRHPAGEERKSRSDGRDSNAVKLRSDGPAAINRMIAKTFLCPEATQACKNQGSRSGFARRDQSFVPPEEDIGLKTALPSCCASQKKHAPERMELRPESLRLTFAANIDG